MAKKVRKGISAPLGVIFGVLLAIILVILAVFIAFNISTSAVKSQSAQLNIVGTPAAFYNKTSLKLTSLSLRVNNPSDTEINVTAIIVAGTKVENATGDPLAVVAPKKTAEITLDAGNTNPALDTLAVTWDDVYRGYIDIVLVTTTGTISTSAQLIGVG